MLPAVRIPRRPAPRGAAPRREPGANRLSARATLPRLLLGLLLAGVLPALADAPPLLRIGVERDSPPLAFLDPQDRPVGYTIELIREMERSGGFTAELVVKHWTQLLQDLAGGRIDTLANVAILEHRREQYDFSIGHARVRAVAYVRTEADLIRSTADLAGRRLAMIEGSIATQNALDHHGWGATLRTFRSYEAALSSVVDGVNDAALFFRPFRGPGIPTVPGLRSGLVDDITYRFHFAVRKGDARTLERLNQALASVQAEGRDQPIYKRWIGPLEPRPLRFTDLRPYLGQAAIILLVVGGVVAWWMHSLSRRARHAEELQRSDARFRNLLESIPSIAVQGYDGSRRVIFWNGASERLYGYTATEAIGRQLEDLIIPDELREGVVQTIGRWIAGGPPPPAEELLLRRKDASRVSVFSSHCLVRNARGDVEMYCVDLDLSERNRALAARREIEERFRRIVETANEGIWTIDPALNTTFVNPRMARMLGCTVDELLRSRLLDWADEDGREFLSGRLRLREEGTSEARDVRFRRVDGSDLWAVVTTNPLQDGSGVYAGALVMVTDVTERRLAEMQLRQSQKMEVVGQLAGGVAHDFNNILTAILLNLNQLRTAADPREQEELVTDLEALAARAAHLTSQLLSLARRQPLQMRPRNLNQALHDLLRMLRRLLGEHIQVETVAESPEIWVEADPGMLDQVLMNLCVNARDAMPGGGRLKLTTGIVSLDASAVRPGSSARPGDFALLRVSDTGVGMSAEVLQHLFEPFYTTKDVGKGTGLGLAAVHGIVHQHRGWIEVDSTPGGGTTFRVYLPLTSRRPAGSPGPAPPAVRPAGVGGRILLVEDEEPVRKVTAGMLQRLGYEVVAAENGPHALRLWEVEAGRFDILISDMVMPGGMSGLQLADTLRALRPRLRVVIISGYSEEINRARRQPDPGIRFLPKPFDAALLDQALAPVGV